MCDKHFERKMGTNSSQGMATLSTWTNLTFNVTGGHHGKNTHANLRRLFLGYRLRDSFEMWSVDSLTSFSIEWKKKVQNPTTAARVTANRATRATHRLWRAIVLLIFFTRTFVKVDRVRSNLDGECPRPFRVDRKKNGLDRTSIARVIAKRAIRVRLYSGKDFRRYALIIYIVLSTESTVLKLAGNMFIVVWKCVPNVQVYWLIQLWVIELLICRWRKKCPWKFE